MDAPPLTVEIVRSGSVESTHLVDVAVVDATGALVASAGSAATLAAFRSSIKPVQARASRAAGWIPSTTEHLAIACASHNGEPAHVRAVRHLLASSDVPEEALRCPAAWPGPARTSAAAGRARRVQHNCSGKHAGFLAACAAAGFPLEGYLSPTHPLQTRIRDEIEAAAGMRSEVVLVDGCGAPTLVFPLTAMARAFTSVLDTDEAAAMLAHPFLVAGTERLDTSLLASGLVTKAGAEGLSCATFVADGRTLGASVKVRDGAMRARIAALVHVLTELGALDPGSIDGALAAPPTLGGGEPVGAARVRGSVTRV
jgi:L-asparaginase II